MLVPIFQQIARQIDRRLRLINSDVAPQTMIYDCEVKLEKLEALLPSGSGIDDGTKINLEKSMPNMIILDSSYHCMEDGYYTEWVDFEVTILPSLAQEYYMEIEIDGDDIVNLSDYLHETYGISLSEKVEMI